MLTLPNILKFKIICTIVVWGLPLLILPASWFPVLGVPVPVPIIWVRLLGAAYLALTATYGLGWIEIQKGRAATQTVWTGILSNGLACAILIYYGITGAWSTWSILGQFLMWLSVFLTGFITILLYPYRHQ